MSLLIFLGYEKSLPLPCGLRLYQEMGGFLFPKFTGKDQAQSDAGIAKLQYTDKRSSLFLL